MSDWPSFLLTLLIACAVDSVKGQVAIPLFPDGAVPGEIPGEIGPEYEYDGRISNVTVPLLEAYLLSQSQTGAAVVVAPGGAYKWLTWDLEGTDIAAWLNSVGVHAFILKYRTPGRDWLPFGEAPLMDAQRAMGLVRSRASEWGLNASRIGFMGFSAGGHLTGHLSTTSGLSPFARSYPRIDAADDVSCRPDFSLMLYPWCLIGDVGDCSQATNFTVNVPVGPGSPPGFLVQAEDDGVHVENSIFYFLALKQRGAPPSELHVYPRGGHGYGRQKCTGLEVCQWPERAETFLQTLGAAPTLESDGRGPPIHKV